MCELIEEGQTFDVDDSDLEQLLSLFEATERLLKRRKGQVDRKKRPTAPLEPDEEHIRLLRWVNQEKYVNLEQVETYLVVDGAAKRLRELEKAKLLIGYRYELHKGQKSKKCYWLSSAGASFLEGAGHKARYNSRLAKTPPSSSDLQLKTMKLELPYRARKAGLRVIEPQTYNSLHPKPEQTPQGKALIAILDARAKRQLEEATAKQLPNLYQLKHAFYNEDHLEAVPEQCNHYVCYVPKTDFVTVLIISPLSANGQFWQSRFEEYSELAKQVKIWAVFYSAELAGVWSKEINKAGLRIVTLPNLTRMFAEHGPKPEKLG
jgi:hypothetical protein